MEGKGSGTERGGEGGKAWAMCGAAGSLAPGSGCGQTNIDSSTKKKGLTWTWASWQVSVNVPGLWPVAMGPWGVGDPLRELTLAKAGTPSLPRPAHAHHIVCQCPIPKPKTIAKVMWRLASEGAPRVTAILYQARAPKPSRPSSCRSTWQE